MYKKIVLMAMSVFILTVGMIGLSILADTNSAIAANVEVVEEDLPEYIEIEDEQIPAGSSVLPETKPENETAKTAEQPIKSERSKPEDIPDEVIPAGTLPQTGGMSPSIICVAGLLITLVGIGVRKYYK